MKTGECRRCGERFPLALRQGRNSRRARAGQERSYQDQRYCSATCRKLASKARRTRPETPVIGPITRARTPVEAVEGTEPLSGVTNLPNPYLNDVGWWVFRPEPLPEPIPLIQLRPWGRDLQMTFGRYTVVPDPEFPAMYRIRRPDGSLTDMVNLTRARDAARHLAEQDRRPATLQRAA